MVKSEEEVVKEFNEIVNMTADELDEFLKTEGSESTGWSKDDGSGESIGHESGRKIVDILRRNPDKDESKYTDEDKEHMRRVVSYCKRHLAQEEHLKNEKSPDELENSKSTRSLKNWGHDPMKTLSGGQSRKPASKKGGKPPSKNEPAKPASKKGGKPASKKAESKAEDKVDEEKEDEEEKKEGKNGKNAGKDDEAETKETEDAEAGDKRAAGESPKTAKPASKKAKTVKTPTEGTRKTPSRGAKKA